LNLTQVIATYKIVNVVRTLLPLASQHAILPDKGSPINRVWTWSLNGDHMTLLIRQTCSLPAAPRPWILQSPPALVIVQRAAAVERPWPWRADGPAPSWRRPGAGAGAPAASPPCRGHVPLHRDSDSRNSVPCREHDAALQHRIAPEVRSPVWATRHSHVETQVWPGIAEQPSAR
jgi:hypothetical protein